MRSIGYNTCRAAKKIMPEPKESLSYEEARKKMRTFCRKKGIKSARHFWRFKASELPQGVPANA